MFADEIGVNLPRWGLKQQRLQVAKNIALGVNLPRWGLKHQVKKFLFDIFDGVNLPRWGLKLDKISAPVNQLKACKFTPLGFETPHCRRRLAPCARVNLPRWGLKLWYAYTFISRPRFV